MRFAADAGVSNRLLLTMTSPGEAVYLKKAVDSVTVPGTEGTFTVTNNHSLIVSQLKAGVITVREGTENKDFFISDGLSPFGMGENKSYYPYLFHYHQQNVKKVFWHPQASPGLPRSQQLVFWSKRIHPTRLH